MLHFFRINDPYRLLGLLGLLIVLGLPLFLDPAPLTVPELKSMVIGEKVAEGQTLYTEVIDSTPPLASWFYGLCDVIVGRNLNARHISAFLVLFLQSVFLGVVMINKKVFTENTYIPSLLFSILTLLSFDMLSLSADLPAFGFLLLAVNALLTEIEFRVQRDETIFNLGLFISVAMLFRFSYLIYLPGFVLILIFFTRSSPRKYLLMLTGFALPHLALACVYFIGGEIGTLWSRFYLPNVSFESTTLITIKGLMVISALPAFYLVISFIMLNRAARLTNFQSQVLQAMFLLLLITVIQVFFTSDLRPQSLLPLGIPVSFFLTHFLLIIRRRKFAEMNTWFLIVGVVAMLYLTRYKKINVVDYSQLVVGTSSVEFVNKRILILNDEPQAYIHNTIAPAFIDWPLTFEVFSNADIYDHVLLVNRLFARDSPEIIIDPENRMTSFFERIPSLQRQYVKSGDHTWVRKNEPDNN